MMTGLLELPPEVMAVVCYHLSSTSLAALDSTCTSLHWTLDRALVWTARARRVNEACAYGCTTGMLEVARERGVEDQRVFKVILGLRKVIKTTVRRFMRRDIEGFSCWKHMMIYRPRGPGSFHAWLSPPSSRDRLREISGCNRILSGRHRQTCLQRNMDHYG